MDFEKSPQNGQISPKCKVVNLNFLTILDSFFRFFKKMQKGSLDLKKRFYLFLSFISCIFLEKMRMKYIRPGRTFPKKASLGLKKRS